MKIYSVSAKENDGEFYGLRKDVLMDAIVSELRACADNTQ